tara:strand:- start:911 stop:1141 length:231 start_codon:yes stop_codon:yes gene_type:complete
MKQVIITTPSGKVITFNKGERIFGYGVEMMKKISIEEELQDWWDEAMGYYNTCETQDKAYSKKQDTLIRKCKTETS